MTLSHSTLKENGLEDYDYINKNISRDRVREFIKDSFVKFDRATALVLEGAQGSTVKNVFDELGFKRENITIVERNRKAFGLMQECDHLEGTNLIFGDLTKFETDVKYDVLYLDTKGHPNDDILDVIKKLLLFNTKSGTILYLNFQAKREQNYITQKYDRVEQIAKNQINALLQLEQRHDRLETDILYKYCRSMSVLLAGEVDDQFIKTIVYSDYARQVVIEQLKLKYNEPEEEPIRKLLREVEEFTIIKQGRREHNKSMPFVKNLHILEGSDTYHVSRASFVRCFIWDTLNMVLQNYHRHRYNIDYENFVNYYSRCKLPVDLTKDLINRYTVMHDLVLSFLRLATNSLVASRMDQFMYMGSKNSPFLSTICQLMDKSIVVNFKGSMAVEGFNAMEISCKSLGIIDLYLRNKIPKHWLESCVASLINEEDWNGISRTNNKKLAEAVTDNIVSMELHHMIGLYRNLRKNRLIDIKDGCMEISTYSYNYHKHTHTVELLDVEDIDLEDVIYNISFFYFIIDHIRGQLVEFAEAFTINELEVIDEGRREETQYNEPEVNYYVRSMSEEDKQWLDAQSTYYIKHRIRVIKNYTREYYSTTKSSEIAAIINRERGVKPFASDFEVRWEKVYITREIRDAQQDNEYKNNEKEIE